MSEDACDMLTFRFRCYNQLEGIHDTLLQADVLNLKLAAHASSAEDGT